MGQKLLKYTFKTQCTPWKFPQLNATGPHSSGVNIGSDDFIGAISSGNGLVPSSSKPAPETNVVQVLCGHLASPGSNELRYFIRKDFNSRVFLHYEIRRKQLCLNTNSLFVVYNRKHVILTTLVTNIVNCEMRIYVLRNIQFSSIETCQTTYRNLCSINIPDNIVAITTDTALAIPARIAGVSPSSRSQYSPFQPHGGCPEGNWNMARYKTLKYKSIGYRHLFGVAITNQSGYKRYLRNIISWLLKTDIMTNKCVMVTK